MQDAVLVSNQTIRMLNPYWSGRVRAVFVDDVEIADVLAVNGTKQWVSHYTRDEDGEIELDDEGFPKIEIVRGKVMLDIIPDSELPDGS